VRQHQRAIGIQIIGGEKDDNSRLVGVVTDRFAKAIAAPNVERLPSVAPDRVVDAIERLVTRLKRELSPFDELVGIGVEVGGLLHDGFVLQSPPLSWHNVPLKSRLSRLLGVEVVLVNDANALAVYERDFPDGLSARDPKHFAVVLLTELGVGCGLVLSKEIYEGVRGGSGELGHIVLVEGERGLPCSCGRKGCLETVATVSAMARILKDAGYEGTFKDALNDSEAPLVAEVLAAGGDALGRAAAMLVNLLNPSTIVLYGQSGIVGETRGFPLTAPNLGTGASGRYLRSMVASLTECIFPNALEDLRIVIRTEKDHRGAEAAAACAIASFDSLTRP
jgi:predicted NBD/HSP70 family sugar kinase